jgi:hypothetical protein
MTFGEGVGVISVRGIGVAFEFGPAVALYELPVVNVSAQATAKTELAKTAKNQPMITSISAVVLLLIYSRHSLDKKRPSKTGPRNKTPSVQQV